MKLTLVSVLASSDLVLETWFTFTFQIYDYIAEYMVFKIRYAPTFNKFTVNSAILFFITFFSWHTIIQKGHHETYNVQPAFKERESTDEECVQTITEQ
jgi:hypothetical protein